MNIMNQHTAGITTGVALGAAPVDKLMTMLDNINAVLHTLTLLVGIVAGVASIIYYWSNRKSKR